MVHNFRLSLFSRILVTNMALRVLSVVALSAILLWVFSREANRHFAAQAVDVAAYLTAESQPALAAGDGRDLDASHARLWRLRL